MFITIGKFMVGLRMVKVSAVVSKNMPPQASVFPPSLTPFRPRIQSWIPLPLYGSRVQGGFPSPADDYLEGELDLNQHLIKHKEATFYVRATGASMVNAGIFPGDLLIVDRALTAKSGSIVIAILNGELTVKKLVLRGKRLFLCPENPCFSEIEITEEQDFSVWGVVTTVIHSVL